MAHRHGRLARYVEKVAARLDEIRLGTTVTGWRPPDGVEVIDGSGDDRDFDAVVVADSPPSGALHARRADGLEIELLGDAVLAEHAQLHTDESLLPRAETPGPRGTTAPRRQPTHGVIVTYDMTRLMRLNTDARFLVTLGGEHLVDPSTVVAG